MKRFRIDLPTSIYNTTEVEEHLNDQVGLMATCCSDVVKATGSSKWTKEKILSLVYEVADVRKIRDAERCVA